MIINKLVKNLNRCQNSFFFCVCVWEREVWSKCMGFETHFFFSMIIKIMINTTSIRIKPQDHNLILRIKDIKFHIIHLCIIQASKNTCHDVLSFIIMEACNIWIKVFFMYNHLKINKTRARAHTYTQFDNENPNKIIPHIFPPQFKIFWFQVES